MKMIKHNRRPFPSLWDEVFDFPLTRNHSGGNATTLPAVNISESEKEYRIELAAPGLNKEDIHIELDQDNLVLSAEKSESKEENKENFSRREFNYSSFSRSFTIPQEKIDADKIEANYKDGVLILRLPKLEKQLLAKKINIS